MKRKQNEVIKIFNKTVLQLIHSNKDNFRKVS